MITGLVRWVRVMHRRIVVDWQYPSLFTPVCSFHLGGLLGLVKLIKQRPKVGLVVPIRRWRRATTGTFAPVGTRYG